MRQRMILYDILTDRTAVNMLKILYDQEHVAKTAHTMPFFRLNALLDHKLSLQTVLRMEAGGLLTAEKVEDMFIISLNTKGKDFIEQLDKLKSIIESQEKTKKEQSLKIEYDLSETDQKILVLCLKMEKEQGCPVSLESIANELYPRGGSSRKTSI
ncbi:MAG: hypothetical protein KJ574_03870, partial [Nanoarchaeota archaeon]|nr:hypothetical protein [Nanoarchaeota archaeon]